jgi:hypothetical protein
VPPFATALTLWQMVMDDDADRTAEIDALLTGIGGMVPERSWACDGKGRKHLLGLSQAETIEYVELVRTPSSSRSDEQRDRFVHLAEKHQCAVTDDAISNLDFVAMQRPKN